MKKLLILAIAVSCLGTSCKQDKATSKKSPESTEKKDIKYKLTAFSPSASFPDAEIKGVEYKSGAFAFDVADGDYKLGSQTPDAAQKLCANSAKGQHIHLIVDNEPYAAKYTADFEYDLEDGAHNMLAFLSRSYHESIKTDKAHVAQQIVVKDKSIVNSQPITEPALFYSRPKGTYVGKANTDKVMLDFYPINCSVGSTQNVVATINGEEHILDKWQPYYIEGLPMGENTVTLSLVGKNGDKVKSIMPPVTRTFTLKADPTE